ncbi:MAG: hypothetical protein IT424_06455 [Pirellulales bacterium]|nr:hypothetical protein [Pirellulales bacterium]
MSELKRFHTGERVTGWPDRTWNELVAGEERDRASHAPGGRGPLARAPGPVHARVRNDTGAALGKGRAVALGAVLVEPTEEDESAVFLGLQFAGEEPTADSRLLAIVLEPLAEDAIGAAVIPTAVWARVDVADEAHEFAAPQASTLLASAASGSIPILWKQSGTGEKWAVVSLAGGGASSIRGAYCMLTASVPALAAIDGTNHTATPGMLAVASDFLTGGGVLLTWTDDAAGWEAEMETDPVGGEEEIKKRRTVVNASKTDIRASVGEPVIGVGWLETPALETPSDPPQLDERFIVVNVMDLRSLPEFDEALDQAPYHDGGSGGFKLGSETCS